MLLLTWDVWENEKISSREMQLSSNISVSQNGIRLPYCVPMLICIFFSASDAVIYVFPTLAIFIFIFCIVKFLLLLVTQS